MMERTVLVIGGGAAGMMAALTAAKAGAHVILAERNEKLGKKIYITGKGRCNLSNNCGRRELIDHVLGQSKFMYSAFSKWDASDTMALFEEAGLPLVTERGNRVFPASGHASDVTKTLEKLLRANRVDIRLRTKAAAIRFRQDERGKSFESAVFTKRDGSEETLSADACIIATGGLSYPSTGSTGDGFRFAEISGHRLTAAVPALVPIETREQWPGTLQGLSLRNVAFTLTSEKKVIYHLPVGEMLFTHFGVSGPAALTASSYLAPILYPNGYAEGRSGRQFLIHIDLKPALSDEELDRRILRELSDHSRKELVHALRPLFPRALTPVVIAQAQLDPKIRADQLTAVMRQRLRGTIKDLTLQVRGLRGYDEAVITHGGVSLKDINPSSMESKVVKDLYFAGEVMDIDALTGGFNLQIAWSTGFVAGTTAAAKHDEYNM